MRADFSRRSFLRGSTLTTAGATLLNKTAALAAEAQTENSPLASSLASLGPDVVPITLHINGTKETIRAEPRMTLAEALRGPLGLTGTKIACNRGACSACTVWLDGQPVCACMILAIDVGQRTITTIEGLARGDELHPVQQAFIDHDALQCGFCTPGIIMSCTALLKHIAEPTADNVRTAISGHYCRCGTYPHVIDATLAAAKAHKA
jgi:xanthine dehydrogenase YagT iron-sulfur-binding subunit